LPEHLFPSGNGSFPRMFVIGSADERAPADTWLLTRRRARSRSRSPNLRPWTIPTFAGPGTVLYVALVFLPLVLALAYSLTNKNLLAPHTRYVGLGNYRELLTDDVFKQSVRTTAIMTALIALIPNGLGLAIALMLRAESRLHSVLRTIFFVPIVLAGVVVSFIWQAMLTDYGVINTVLGGVGLHRFEQGWLDTPNHALGSIVAVVTWQYVGFCAVIYLAALKSIPDELIEAAQVDGCTGFRRFRRITWPLVAPAVTINTVLLLITGFKLFDYVKIITDGGPGGATNNMALNIYNVGFTQNAFGLASAQAVVLFAIVAVLSTAAVLMLRRREVEL
jgi:multiple sugar transport system permease protein